MSENFHRRLVTEKFIISLSNFALEADTRWQLEPLTKRYHLCKLTRHLQKNADYRDRSPNVHELTTIERELLCPSFYLKLL